MTHPRLSVSEMCTYPWTFADDRTGLSLIADLGNCWTERDVEPTVRRASSRYRYDV
ncbi:MULTISPECIES: hypothetical protein [Pseudofrankia]|uniref:hypothetical protein n=1 Tax=Pseudofrankia TaxID=2994363 RepID=UPI000234BBD2|nr:MULTISPECIES: hypothetical protein [Pseudofrankia]